MIRTALPVVVALVISSSAAAQTPSDVKGGIVAVIEENPGIRLATLMTAFDKAYGERPFPVRTARFERSGDTATAWRESIKSDGYAVELVWRDFYEPFAIESRVGVPHNPYTILSTFVPARTAEVVINGKRAAGSATPRMRGTRQSSSSFLAFAETWLK